MMSFLNFNFKNACISVALASTAFVVINAVAAPTSSELKQVLECQSDYDHYHQALSNYEEDLPKLGWKRLDDPHQPFIYIYKNIQAVEFFGMPTHEIGLSSNAIFAIYRQADVKKLAKKYGIEQHPMFANMPFFRGEKILRTEAETDDLHAINHKLSLSEMTGKSPMILLGCNYEFDQGSIEEALADLED
ncbi:MULTISPECIES: hypothetical protein [Acinetobacter]|uniref:hypothetical protein n=1 Tax=Acinetobacter TaxID=469 RepID=UPI001443A1C8|nr:hypothetical protein [Acinetobacter cumulans]